MRLLPKYLRSFLHLRRAFPSSFGFLLLLFAVLYTGCGEQPGGEQIGDMPMAESSSPYVRSTVHEGSEGKTGIVVKYLPPRFLASEEVKRGAAALSLDSLTSLYAQSMSFVVSVKNPGGNIPKPTDSTSIPDAFLPDDLKEYFRIEAGDTLYAPDIVQLEHHDGHQRRYIVLFSVDPRQAFAGVDRFTFAFANPEGSSGIERFQFAVADILHSSTTLAQLTR